MSRWKVLLLFLTTLLWSAEPFASTSSPATIGRGRATRKRRLGRRSNKSSSSRCLTFPTITRTPASIALYDVLRDGEAHQNGGTSSKISHSGPRWHRRLWSKLLRRRDSSPSTPLHMTVMMDEETKVLLESIDAIYQQHQLKKDHEFITRNFETLTPAMVLPEVSVNIDDGRSFDSLDSEFFDVTLTPASNTYSLESTEQDNTDDASSSRKGISLPRLLGLLFENILTSRILRASSEDPDNLLIQVEPLENTVGRLFRGQFLADVKLSAKRIIFPRIRFSSINVELEQVTLNLLGFLQQPQTEQQTNPAIRYPKQFDLHVRGLTMSHHDLHHSPCVTNGLRRLLINILKNRGIESSSIQITSMDILPNGKISCKGEARTLFGTTPLPFEVRTGISFSNRGHVLTFPGLEVSLNRDFGLFVPVMPTLDLDVGHNARFEKIQIDGSRKLVTVDASVTITPDRTIRLMQNYKQSSEAFSAQFFYDVGQWLTRVGNFTV